MVADITAAVTEEQDISIVAAAIISQAIGAGIGG